MYPLNLHKITAFPICTLITRRKARTENSFRVFMLGKRKKGFRAGFVMELYSQRMQPFQNTDTLSETHTAKWKIPLSYRGIKVSPANCGFPKEKKAIPAALGVLCHRFRHGMLSLGHMVHPRFFTFRQRFLWLLEFPRSPRFPQLLPAPFQTFHRWFRYESGCGR